MRAEVGRGNEDKAASFKAEGSYENVPYRFMADGTIDAAIGGSVVRFASFDAFVGPRYKSPGRRYLALLLGLHFLACCASILFVQRYYAYIGVVGFDAAFLPKALLSVLPFALLVVFFLFSSPRAIFGYSLSFYFFTVVLGYAWLLPFSLFPYGKVVAWISIFLSAIAFFVPAIFMHARISRRFELSKRGLDLLLAGILILSGVILVLASRYHFQMVGVDQIYEYRNAIEQPALLRYGTGIAIGALLPFCFAVFVMQRRWIGVAIACALFLLFYPVTLAKLALLAPAWLLFLAVLSRFFEARAAIVLSLLLPLLGGLVTAGLLELGVVDQSRTSFLFGVANFRMLAVPAISLDLYNDFFSRNPHTYFCQISFLKPFVDCPYEQQLSLVLERAYGFGTLNASLFATEGIASVGMLLAPLSAFACGLVIAGANACSGSLPQRFLILSAGMALQNFLSVPMTTTLLTNGAAVLFLLWYITPASALRTN